ncbi:hypothetical protein Bp8pS_079 [Bacillus phage vB_BpuM-BpSp]|nr:hypothetical protein Bp8pS_079 [Bacillus phage vB_BpuM-BpSp]
MDNLKNRLEELNFNIDNNLILLSLETLDKRDLEIFKYIEHCDNHINKNFYKLDLNIFIEEFNKINKVNSILFLRQNIVCFKLSNYDLTEIGGINNPKYIVPILTLIFEIFLENNISYEVETLPYKNDYLNLLSKHYEIVRSIQKKDTPYKISFDRSVLDTGNIFKKIVKFIYEVVCKNYDVSDFKKDLNFLKTDSYERENLNYPYLDLMYFGILKPTGHISNGVWYDFVELNYKLLYKDLDLKDKGAIKLYFNRLLDDFKKRLENKNRKKLFNKKEALKSNQNLRKALEDFDKYKEVFYSKSLTYGLNPLDLLAHRSIFKYEYMKLINNALVLLLDNLNPKDPDDLEKLTNLEKHLLNNRGRFQDGYDFSTILRKELFEEIYNSSEGYKRLMTKKSLNEI